MKYLFGVLSWIFGCLFFLLFLLSLFSRHFVPSILILIITVMLIPPARQWLSNLIRIPFPLWLRSLLIPVLLFLFIFLIFKGMGNKDSIYKNPEIERKLMAIYKNRIAQWPVPAAGRRDIPSVQAPSTRWSDIWSPMA